MKDLSGKHALVVGIANKRSLAYACAQALYARGAKLALAYLDKGVEGKDGRSKALKLTQPLQPEHVLPVNAEHQESVVALFKTLQHHWGTLDIFVHSIAHAKREELAGNFSDTSLEGYLLAQHVSAYSLISFTKEAKPLMENGHGASVVCMSYIGALRTVLNYNVMGSAKAALEANVRYLAAELGPQNIRVNAISAGPVRTLSSAGVGDFLGLLHNAKDKSALKRNITAQEVGNTCAFLSSEASSGITGQVVYVDGGYNIYG